MGHEVVVERATSWPLTDSTLDAAMNRGTKGVVENGDAHIRSITS